MVTKLMKNNDKTLNLDLIHAAQDGDQTGRATLAELIGPKVYAYVYRMTLDVHLAEDLSQETMVGLIRNLQQLKLNDPMCLWAWIYKTALNQVRDYYNHQRAIQNGNIQMRQSLHSRARRDRAKTGPETIMHQELLTAVTRAINTLKIQYRNILTLRCFQELSYAEIAQVIDNTELGARLLFYRAKRSLVRQLAREGYSKSKLLTALSLFAAATISPIEKASAATVGAAAIHTGLGIKLLAAIRASYDPDQSGWYGAMESQSHTALSHAPGQIQLEQWLDNPAGSDKYWLHIPQDHWIEITFDGVIVDGQGDDIFIVERCCHGECAEISLADDNGNVFPLATLQVPYSGQHKIATYGYDLAGLDLPFTPTAVRIKTTNSGYYEYREAMPGMELLNIRARTSQ